MVKRITWTALGFGVGAAAAFYCSGFFWLGAQQTERPGGMRDNPHLLPRDPSGLSLKMPRIRVVHTVDPSKAGGSMYLQQVDPWLGYQWGRALTQRNFRQRDGVFGQTGNLDGIVLPDGVTRMMDRSHSSSCGSCHNVPYRDAGAGMTIPKNGGTGRNTPHMFGAGVMEMIGLQMRLQALAQGDVNRDGWISLAEAKGKMCKLKNLPAEVNGQSYDIDLGSFDDRDKDGYPDLNPVLFPIFVDRAGKRLAQAKSLYDTNVAGYTFEVQVFGFGHLYAPGRPPVSTTIRAFSTTPFDIHSSMQACDPTTFRSQFGDALGGVSNAGAQQFVTAASKDLGKKKGATGLSLDDPDGDGYCEEITEGDLDVVEWYLLNHPAPARGRQTPDVVAGEKLFHNLKCAECHVPDWHLQRFNPAAADYTERFAGDRRFFELDVKYNEQTSRLEGKVVYLADKVGARWLPRRRAYTARGVYSDFKYHDVGPAFYQTQFDGSIVKMWRTTPLWGVGSTAPYGHDGADLDLDAVIRRHGGEALASRQAYVALSDNERRQVLEFLRSLVLYQTDQLPTDINGDGKIDDHFLVQGMDTGVERFHPDWLFRVPGKIEGPTRNPQGDRITSFALTNLRDAYGLGLEYLKDTDGDGFPDVIDPAPRKPGLRDGER